MRKSLKILIIILVIILVLILVLLGIKYLKPNEKVDNKIQTNSIAYDTNDAVASINAVVVKANDSDLIAIRVDNPDTLVSVSYPDNVNKDEFKQGQQITVYYDGSILDSYPEQLEKVEKIEVVKDKGDVDIPYSALRYCFSSRDNVEVSVDELTKSGISFTINDKNEYKYEYDNEYSIFKKNKEAENVESPNIPALTSGNTTSSYDGSGVHLWDEVQKTSNVDAENAEINDSDDTTKVNVDWTSVYGELGEGDYEFVLNTSEAFGVRIAFTINENGEVSNISTSLS